MCRPGTNFEVKIAPSIRRRGWALSAWPRRPRVLLRAHRAERQDDRQATQWKVNWRLFEHDFHPLPPNQIIGVFHDDNFIFVQHGHESPFQFLLPEFALIEPCFHRLP